MTGVSDPGTPSPPSGGGSRGWAHRIAIIWRLEAAQMVRPGSLFWAAALAALPAALLVTLRLLQPPAVETAGAIDLWLYVLIPILLCPLGLILTATSAIHSEIENRTWVYLALRPGARLAALGGKYLFAVSWVLSIAVSATLLTAVALWGVVPLQTVGRTLVLATLSAFAYGALYLLVGVAFLRIGMVVAIAYSLVVEVVLGNAPAVLNRVTISHHIRSVFLRALPEGTLPDGLTAPFLSGAGSMAMHLTVLLGMTLAFLSAAGGLLRMREIAVGDAD